MSFNKINFLSIAVILSIMLLYSCSDDSSSSNNNNYNLITSLRGNIIGLPSNARMVKGIVETDTSSYVIASNTVGIDEAMNLNLITPPSEFLIDINAYFTSHSGEIIISNNDANVCPLRTYVYYDTSGGFAGLISKDNHTGISPGFFAVGVLYCDRNLSIIGTDTRIFNNDTTVNNFNANLGNGWNVFTTRIKSKRTNYIEYELFNGEPSGANWYFYGLGLRSGLIQYSF